MLSNVLCSASFVIIPKEPLINFCECGRTVLRSAQNPPQAQVISVYLIPVLILLQLLSKSQTPDDSREAEDEHHQRGTGAFSAAEKLRQESV